MREQTVLAGSAVLGFAGMPWVWSIAPAMVLLMLSTHRVSTLMQHHGPLGVRVGLVALWATGLHAIVFSGAAFALGTGLARLIS